MFPKVSAVARTRPEGLVRFADSARSFAVALFASAVFLGAGYALFWKPVLDRWVF